MTQKVNQQQIMKATLTENMAKINSTAKLRAVYEEEKKQGHDNSTESQPTNHVDDINLAMNHHEIESLDSSSLLKFTRSNITPEGGSRPN